MLNVGIISSWHVHTDEYADELVNSKRVMIKAMWDEDPVRGAKWAERYNTEFVEDYDAFLSREDIDAVICDSPTTMHPELLKKAAEKGKHIFTEKLLAVDTENCKMLCEAIESQGVTFTISLPLRADGKMLYAKKLVEEGKLGRISGARMRRSHNGVSADWLPKYWYDTTKTGGGAMMDLGAHPVYLLSFLFGAPKRLTGLTTNLCGTSGDENAIALAEFEGGILGTCETAFVTTGVPDILEIYGTEGSLFIRGDEVLLSTRDGMTAVTEEEMPASRPLPVIQFVEACLNKSGTPEYLGTADALVMTRMIEACYQADQTNTTIKF